MPCHILRHAFKVLNLVSQTALALPVRLCAASRMQSLQLLLGSANGHQESLSARAKHCFTNYVSFPAPENFVTLGNNLLSEVAYRCEHSQTLVVAFWGGNCLHNGAPCTMASTVVVTISSTIFGRFSEISMGARSLSVALSIADNMLTSRFKCPTSSPL